MYVQNISQLINLCAQVEVAAASKALQLLQGRLVCVSEVASESAEGPRTAVVVHKQGPTPAR